MKVFKKYAVLVINNLGQPRKSSDYFVKSLFTEINKVVSVSRPSSSVSIHPEHSESDQSSSWSVRIESSRRIDHLLIKEYSFPHTVGPSSITYLLWYIGVPLRAVEYFINKLIDIWHESSLASQKTSGIIRMIAEAFRVALRTLVFVYLFPLMSFVIIRPLRKMGLFAAITYFFMIIAIVVSLTWQQTLLPIIKWTIQFTHQLINLIADNDLTFDILYPVIAGAVFAVLLTLIIALLRTARWIVSRFDTSYETTNLQTMTDLSYLLDPLYAAKVRDNFERYMINLNIDSDYQSIFVLCEHSGILLAYEVLSRICPSKISKPVYLLTLNMSFAGFLASPISSLWLVDYQDWDRFSKNTPVNLSWHHFTGWPTEEYSVKIISRREYRIPHIIRHSEKVYLFKGDNSAAVNRIVSLLRLT